MTITITRNALEFNFPEIVKDAKCSIDFLRTLRTPDDGKSYPLPPSLGNFPLEHVDDFKSKVPAKWLEHGGIMTALHQSEALWLKFGSTYVDNRGVYPFAIKVAAGKISAISGEPWSTDLKSKDYVVAPIQPWLDGYSVGDGLVRQFVAAPLGAGFSVEEQLTGKPEFGGIQIEVIPMKWSAFIKRFPQVVHAPDSRFGTRRYKMGAPTIQECSESSKGIFAVAAAACYTDSFSLCDSDDDCSRGLDMGLAAGGLMKQQIMADPYDLSDWDISKSQRVFIHLANSALWKDITGKNPPQVPLTAKDYTAQGFPWYDYYSDAPSLGGSAKLAGVKSLKTLADEKGIGSILLPGETSVNIPKISNVGPNKRPDVRDGKW